MMKKLLLTVLIFTLLNGFLFSNEIIVSVLSEASTLNEAKIKAENEFRRKVLIYVAEYYKIVLGEYYYLWQESGQNFDRDLINDLVKAGNTSNRSARNHIYIINLSLDSFEAALQDNFNKSVAIRNLDLSEDIHINDLLYLIDIFSSFPSNSYKHYLQTLITLLQSINIDYNPKHIVIQEKYIDLSFKTNYDFNLSLDFTYDGDLINKKMERNNQIIQRVWFNSADKNLNDINIKTNNTSSEYTIYFSCNFEASFNLNRYKSNLFLNSLLSEFFSNKNGFVEIFYVNDSRFLVTSTNFPAAINEANNLLNRIGWTIGNRTNYTHTIEITKIILEEKTLNIGSYYLKGNLEMKIFDKSRSLLQTIKSKSFEAIDNNSMEACRSKLDKMLLESVKEMRI